jgi:magnesium-protoporphyrin IX monomethyl ester (oxidative) cyclase
VIIETNKSSERLFPAVPDVEHPDFFRRMDRLVELSDRLGAISKSGMPKPLQALARLPVLERMVAEMVQIYLMTPKDTGSVDLLPPEQAAQVMY